MNLDILHIIGSQLSDRVELSRDDAKDELRLSAQVDETLWEWRESSATVG